MKWLIFLLLILEFVLSLQNSEEHFIKFIRDHKRKYKDSVEFNYRFGVFKENVKRINRLNADYKGVTFKINKFGDLTKEEFKERYLTQAPVRNLNWPIAKEVPSEVINNLPTSFDWRTKGAVTDVKDQGSCGSCWAFSATGNIEGQWFLSGHKLMSLSEQNLVDCDHECTTFEDQQSCDSGCDGGLQPNAYTYVIKNKGIDSEDAYPYQGVDGTCNFTSSNIGAKISNFTMISSDEDQMAAYLVQNGPIAIAANAEEWQFYFGGVFYIPCATSLDHGILIVGYGVETDIFDQTMPFWIVKNSWGESWGESGYIRIERGAGKCGLNQYVSSSIV